MRETKLIYPDLSYKIVGILFKVQNELGNKYQEKYYQRAIEVELKNQNIKYSKEIPVDFRICKRKNRQIFSRFFNR